MICVKQGVVLASLTSETFLYPAFVVERVWKENGWGDPTITGGIEGKHLSTSYHYKGVGHDFRFPTWPKNDLIQIKKAVGLLVEALPDYDVIQEATHIHIEPKIGGY